jgi:diguanylate cyclase (GGDEF)-like protein
MLGNMMNTGKQGLFKARKPYQLLLIILAAVELSVAVYFDSMLETESLADGEQLVLDEGWKLTADSLVLASDIMLPYYIEGDVMDRAYRVTRRLPDQLPNTNASLSLETSMSSLEVYVDDQRIYRFTGDQTPWGRPVLGGGFTHFIRLPDWAAGKELSLKMEFSANNTFAGRIKAPVIGTKSDQILSEMRELPSLAFGFIFLFTGLVCALTALGLRRGIERDSIWYFGWLEIALGAWVFTQNCAKILIIRNPVLPMNFSLAALFFLPYVLIQYVRVSYHVIERKLKPFQYAAYLFLAAYIAGGIGQYTGLFQYTDMLPIAGLSLIVYIIALSIVLLVDYKKGNRELISFLAAAGVLLVTVAAEEILLLMKIAVDNAVLLHLGMSLCGAVLLVHSAKIISQGRRTQFREQMLLELAYTDSLTGLSNRTAYENRIAEISTGARRTTVVGILLCDVNDLKPINDSLGHAAGDQLLKDFAVRITDMLPYGSEIYRIGGDEFVALISDITEERLQMLSDRITTTEFSIASCDYSVAVGQSLFRRDRHTSFERIIKEADDRMYLRKVGMKSEVSQRQDA